MKILLLNISDIHVLSQDKPENEGLVLGKFIEDVEEQKKKFEYDDVYVLISGDLVFAASDESYSKFDEVIVQELIRIFNIDRSHFIIAPWNHGIRGRFLDPLYRNHKTVPKSNFTCPLGVSVCCLGDG